MLEAFRKLLRALGLADAEHGGGGNGTARTSGDDARRVDMLSCEEVLERLFEYLDDELGSPTKIQVEAHLEKCRRCYPRLQFEKAFMEALERARAGEEPPRDLRNRVIDILFEEGLELN